MFKIINYIIILLFYRFINPRDNIIKQAERVPARTKAMLTIIRCYDNHIFLASNVAP